jgi:hypothetical protein
MTLPLAIMVRPAAGQGGLHTERLRGSVLFREAESPGSLSTLGFENSSFATSRIFRSLFSWPKPRSEKPSDRSLAFSSTFRGIRTDNQSEACKLILTGSAVRTGLYFAARYTGYHEAIYAVRGLNVESGHNRTIDFL